MTFSACLRSTFPVEHGDRITGEPGAPLALGPAPLEAPGQIADQIHQFAASLPTTASHPGDTAMASRADGGDA